MLALIVDEAVVQDGYMNALTDGFGGSMSTDVLILLSVLLAVVVVAVLAVALIERPPAASTTISEGLATLADALEGVEAEHLRPLEPAVKAINAQFDIILGALPGIGAQGRDRRRAEAAMTLWWIGDIVLLVVIVPVVVYLLNGVLERREEHRPERRPDRGRRRRRARRISTPRRCC